MSKRDFKAGIEASSRVIAEYHKLAKENGSSASSCSHRCDNCRHSMELEHRYDQVRCCNDDSPEAWGDVECSYSCQFFEVNADLSDREN